MTKAILYDGTKCIACRGCQVACKKWNELPAEEHPTFSASWTNPKDLSARTWLYQDFVELVGDDGKLQGWYFVRNSCMHCDDPACKKVCPVSAITKYPEGPVVIDQDKCMGCRYCYQACPWKVPRFSYDDEKMEKVVTYKCTMCADRTLNGGKPSCVSTCVADALLFGEKEEILAEAKKRAEKTGGFIYGEKEAGGTSVVYVLPVEPSKLGLLDVHQKTIMDLPSMASISFAGFGAAAVALAGLYYYAKQVNEDKKER